LVFYLPFADLLSVTNWGVGFLSGASRLFGLARLNSRSYPQGGGSDISILLLISDNSRQNFEKTKNIFL
jgi:hypothetical protein